jgi:hypothetical protein
VGTLALPGKFKIFGQRLFSLLEACKGTIFSRRSTKNRIGHTKWPTKLDRLDVFTNPPEVIPERQTLYPVPNGLFPASDRQKIAGIRFSGTKSKCTVCGTIQFVGNWWGTYFT